MTFEVKELQMAGIDERNITTVHAYEEYLRQHLPATEVIRDMYICIDYQMLLSDLYFFTDGLMIEIPDFVTYYQGKFHPKIMDFTVHPIRKAVIFLHMKISEANGADPRSIEVNFGLEKGDTFSFTATKDNTAKLERIAAVYLMPNLDND